MSRTWKLRGYQSKDEERLLCFWARVLAFDAVDAKTFRRKVVLDPNFDPSLLLIAEASDGEMIGFCLGVIRKVPMEKVGMEPEKGWITAFGVDPKWQRKGVGSSLIGEALELFGGCGRHEIWVSPYTPNYFVPGVDVERYPKAVTLLQQHGFEVISRPLSMDAMLVTWTLPEWVKEREEQIRADGIEIQTLPPNRIPDFLGFLKAHMPGDWVRHARELLIGTTDGRCDFEQFLIAVRGDEVIGYCQFEGEHFGPFGVRDDHQGRGIGSVLLGRSLEQMRKRGYHNAWLLWTDDHAAKLYERFGFRESRRFAIMRRML